MPKKRKQTSYQLVLYEQIEETILLIRGKKVILDADLARLYGVTTTQLNQQVKRNLDRFPEDFMFRLTSIEKKEVVTNCDHLKHLRYASTLPYAFTEYGAVMLASVLSSPVAVRASVEIVRAFIRLRKMRASHRESNERIDKLEHKYDLQFRQVFHALRQLTNPVRRPKCRIGFHT